MDPLANVDGWPSPADEAAIVVVTAAHGVVARRGPVDSALPLASVTKLLTAYALLVATEERSVALDEPAGPPGATVRHLLAHTSGLPFEGGPPIAAPGRRRIYSNSGFEVLAAHVERATGMAFADYLAEGVLQPLAMAGTALAGSAARDGWAPASDLGRFAAELLAPTLVDRRTLHEATTVAFPGLAGMLPGIGRFDPNDWGLGFELRAAKSPHWTGTRCSARTFGHFGAAGTFLWVDPAAGVALVGLTTAPFGPWARERWPALSDAVLDRWSERPIR